MDHCFPFKAKNAHNRLSITIDTVVDILQAVHIGPIPKWADELFPIRFPDCSTLHDDGSISYLYPYDLSALKDAVAPLCIPWHTTKWNDFSSSPVYLGLIWDFDHHTFALSEPKREKYLTKICEFLCAHSTSRVRKKLAMSILGTLSHVTIVHQDGRSYLSALSTFISSFTSEFKPRYPSSAVFKDLEWWVNKLSVPNLTRPLSPHGQTQDLGIYVDASKSWGIGIVIRDQWEAWQWSALWHFEGRNIGWAEAVAVELLTNHFNIFNVLKNS